MAMQGVNAESVQLVPAAPVEPELVADLMHATDPHIFDWLHAHDMALVRRHLGYQWQQTNGIFSHRFCTMAVHEGELVGIELGFDHATHQAELEPFITHAHQQLNEAQFAHFAGWFEFGGYVLPPIPEDAWYLQNLAIVEAARGRGIGDLLLANAIERSRAAGYARLHLDLYDGNPAIRLYERAGLRTIVETRVPPLVSEGVGLHLRMELKL
jgi:ribosomal protein S18 acetylase RimI-like enzyme